MPRDAGNSRHDAAVTLALSSRTAAMSMQPKHKPSRITPPVGDPAAAAIYAVIRRIPRGWVATYGQVLRQLGPATDIPWHRVVNAKGEVSYALSRNGGDVLQQRLLEKEGVEFDNRNRFDLERFRWPE
jgi:methylated-DNA-protein-cysteine methyltransferase related protein